MGEKRGDQYIVGAVGYLRQAARLPDFVGGPVFGGFSVSFEGDTRVYIAIGQLFR